MINVPTWNTQLFHQPLQPEMSMLRRGWRPPRSSRPLARKLPQQRKLPRAKGAYPPCACTAMVSSERRWAIPRARARVRLSRGRPQLPVRVQIAVTLLRCGHHGNAASIILTATTFAVIVGSVGRATQQMTAAILCWKAAEIRWLDASQPAALAGQSKLRYGFPRCVGAVDGTTIPLAHAPSEDPWCVCWLQRSLSRECLGCVWLGGKDYHFGKRVQGGGAGHGRPGGLPMAPLPRSLFFLEGIPTRIQGDVVICLRHFAAKKPKRSWVRQQEPQRPARASAYFCRAGHWPAQGALVKIAEAATSISN